MRLSVGVLSEQQNPPSSLGQDRLRMFDACCAGSVQRRCAGRFLETLTLQAARCDFGEAAHTVIINSEDKSEGIVHVFYLARSFLLWTFRYAAARLGGRSLSFC